MAPAGAPPQPGYSTVPAASISWRPRKEPVGAGPPSVPQVELSLSQCQVPNYSSSCSPGPSGQQGELCAAVHREREGVDGKRGQQHSRAGGRHRAMGFMPALYPTQPELALQPASLGGGQECTSPATGTCATRPDRAMAALRFVSRILSQGNHTVLSPRNTFCEVSKCP